MASGKKSFLLYTNIWTMVEKLPDEKAGQLFKLILAYVNDTDPQTDDLLLQIAFEPIKQQLKSDLRKWEEYIDKQKGNGKKGGRPSKDESAQNPVVTDNTQAFSEETQKTQAFSEETQKTQAFFEKPKKAVFVNVIDNVIVNDNELIPTVVVDINKVSSDYKSECVPTITTTTQEPEPVNAKITLPIAPHEPNAFNTPAELEAKTGFPNSSLAARYFMDRYIAAGFVKAKGLTLASVPRNILDDFKRDYQSREPTYTKKYIDELIRITSTLENQNGFKWWLRNGALTAIWEKRDNIMAGQYDKYDNGDQDGNNRKRTNYTEILRDTDGKPIESNQPTIYRF